MFNRTIVVQGPLNETSFKAYDYYKDQGEVLYSHWNTDRMPPIPEHFSAEMVPSPLPQTPHVAPIHKNRMYKRVSTYEGLKKVTTEYAAIVRSDSLFEKLPDPTGKIQCSGMFFKSWNFLPFHLGDYFIQGPTEVLRDAYRRMVEREDTLSPPEVCLADSILKALGVEFDMDVHKNSNLYKTNTKPTRQGIEHMDHFEIIPMEEFGRFECPCNALNTVFTHNNLHSKKGAFHFQGDTMEELLDEDNELC